MKDIKFRDIFIALLITITIMNAYHIQIKWMFFVIYVIVLYAVSGTIEFSYNTYERLTDKSTHTDKTIRYNVHDKTIGKFSELSISNIKDNFLINDNIVRTFYLKNGKQLSIKQLLNYFEEDIINFDQIDNILYINDIQVKAIRFKDGKYFTIGQLIKAL